MIAQYVGGPNDGGWVSIPDESALILLTSFNRTTGTRITDAYTVTHGSNGTATLTERDSL